MKIQSRRRILLFQWGGKRMKRKIIAVIAGILIFGWAYWLVPYSPIPDTVNITEMRVYQLDRGRIR